MPKKILYKNHCTPQEQISSGGRYYLDSDCGRKLTGNEEFTLDAPVTAYVSSEAVTTTPESLGADKDFVFIKNTGSTDVVISLTTDATAKYVIKLSEGEAFASKISTSASVRVKTLSGTSTIEYFFST